MGFHGEDYEKAQQRGVLLLDLEVEDAGGAGQWNMDLRMMARAECFTAIIDEYCSPTTRSDRHQSRAAPIFIS